MVARKTRLVVLIALAGAALVLVAITLSQGLSWRQAATAAESSLPVTQHDDRPAAPLRGTTVSGQPFDLEQLRGDVVIINVMASWCAPCRQELPVLVDAASRWRSQHVRVVGVAMRDQAADTASLLRDSGATALTVVADSDGSRAVEWGVRGVPESFIVDRRGHLRVHAFGPITADWLQQQLTPLVGP
jgi:cytochrome c biogenesis protein CcmG/thiol:disulfide interchange protein DsbE